MKGKIFRIILTVLILGGIFVGIIFRMFIHSPDLADIEQYTKLHMPKDTKVVHSLCESSWDSMDYYAILEFDARYTDCFLKSIPYSIGSISSTKMSREDRFGILDHSSPLIGLNNPGWWNPDSVSKFISVKVEHGRDELYLLIDMDNSKHRKVYLFAFDT